MADDTANQSKIRRREFGKNGAKRKGKKRTEI
jgi:hypothetical protein